MVTWSQSSHVVNAQKTLATMRQEPSSTMSGPLLNLGDSQDRKLAPFLRKNLVVRLGNKEVSSLFLCSSGSRRTSGGTVGVPKGWTSDCDLATKLMSNDVMTSLGCDNVLETMT